MSALFDLTGRTALITGSVRGIGYALAEGLAAQGASVVVNSRQQLAVDEAVCKLKVKGYAARGLAFDVADEAAVIAAFAQLDRDGVEVDILINNAGMPDAQRAHKMSLELIDNVIGVNLRGPWILSCEVARRLIAAGKPGRMVNISSVAHYKYDGNGAALYAVTKTAIARMTDALSMEWAPYNINVNAIAPGMFVSEMTDGMFERMGGNPAPHVARKRIPVPEQMDSTLLYLVAPASECVTGAIIKIDDGQGSAVRLRS